jgi:hypothetical protein
LKKVLEQNYWQVGYTEEPVMVTNGCVRMGLLEECNHLLFHLAILSLKKLAWSYYFLVFFLPSISAPARAQRKKVGADVAFCFYA